MNIIHLLSWCPTPENPTLGNFCIRMIQSLPQDCYSVILSVCNDNEKKTTLHTINEKGFVHLQYRTTLPHSSILRKIKYIMLYQQGLNYVRKHYFTPDLVHLHVAYPLGIIARIWKRLYAYPYVLTEHWSIYQPQNQAQFKGKLKRSVIRTGKQAEMILPVSKNLQHCMESYNINNNYQVIYNLVDTSLFKIGNPQKNIKKKHILHVSTLQDEVKNFSGILRATTRLYQHRKDFELHVIHDYPAKNFEEYIQQHKLSECVFLHGKKAANEVAKALSTAHFFLLFSNYENLPCVLVEALAAGVPVLATDVGGIAEIIDSERGILIQAKDENALFEEMNHMLDHANNYNREAIRAFALQHFSLDHIGAQIRQAYLSALSSKK